MPLSRSLGKKEFSLILKMLETCKINYMYFALKDCKFEALRPFMSKSTCHAKLISQFKFFIISNHMIILTSKLGENNPRVHPNKCARVLFVIARTSVEKSRILTKSFSPIFYIYIPDYISRVWTKMKNIISRHCMDFSEKLTEV